MHELHFVSGAQHSGAEIRAARDRAVELRCDALRLETARPYQREQRRSSAQSNGSPLSSIRILLPPRKKQKGVTKIYTRGGVPLRDAFRNHSAD